MRTVEDVERIIALTENLIGCSFIEETPRYKAPTGEGSWFFSFPLLVGEKVNADQELLVSEISDLWSSEGFDVYKRDTGPIVEVMAETDKGATLHLGINNDKFVLMAASEPIFE